MLNDFNVQDRVRDPIMLIDELSATEYYIGISNNFKDPSKPHWRIRRIWKIGSVWHFGYPDGKQDFKYVWDDRLSYTYKM
jgi:hypothetical protein